MTLKDWFDSKNQNAVGLEPKEKIEPIEPIVHKDNLRWTF